MELLDRIYATGRFTMSVLKKMVTIKSKPDRGFRQFFNDDIKSTKGVKFWIRRRNRRIATDINVYEKGQIVRSDKTSQKFFIGANFDNKFDYSALEEFETTNGADGSVIDDNYKALVENTAEGMAEIDDAFERAEELMCSQVMLTGVVTMNNGTDVDFKRQASSLVAYAAGNDFSISTVNPETVFVRGAEFIISEGNFASGTIFNVILGESAFIAFKNNPIVQAQGNLRRMDYIETKTGTPIQGLTPQGVYSAGSHNFKIYTYKGYYNHPTTGALTNFMDPKAMVMFPENLTYDFVYFPTKNMVKNGDRVIPRLVAGKRSFYEIVKEEECAIQMGERSCFLPIITDVDSIWTATILN